MGAAYRKIVNGRARRFTLVSEAYLAPSSINRDAPGTYQGLGITVERVMTDNGSCCKSLSFHEACKRLGLKPTRTKPYIPKTNGKAEGFIQTSLREWAYAQAYNSSEERAAELPRWLHRYNWHRPHGKYRLKATDQQTRSGCEQPLEAPHLVRAVNALKP
jgi:Integrase core domain